MENCINTKIEQALKNKDIKNIMHKASSRFMKGLDQDTIYTCQINALWKAFVNFKPEKNTKFTTYLYKGVFIECLKAIKFERRQDFCSRSIHANIPAKNQTNTMFDILDAIDSHEDMELILDKYQNMTIQEMADKREYSRETVRKKLKKIYSQLKIAFD